MEFLSALKIGAALSISLIIVVLMVAYVGVVIVMTVGSLFFWDTNISFSKQNLLLRTAWLFFLLPLSVALFLYIAPHVQELLQFIRSFV